MSGEKECPKCGAHFHCGPGPRAQGAGCWCEDLPPALPLVSDTTCMCPRCLTETIQKIADERGGRKPGSTDR